MKEEYFNQYIHTNKTSEHLQKILRPISISQYQVQKTFDNKKELAQDNFKQTSNICNIKHKITNQDLVNKNHMQMKINKYQQLKQKIEELKCQQNRNIKNYQLSPIKQGEQQRIGSISGVVRNFKRLQKYIEQKNSEYEGQLEWAKMKINKQKNKINQLERQKQISQQNRQNIIYKQDRQSNKKLYINKHSLSYHQQGKIKIGQKKQYLPKIKTQNTVKYQNIRKVHRQLSNIRHMSKSESQHQVFKILNKKQQYSKENKIFYKQNLAPKSSSHNSILIKDSQINLRHSEQSSNKQTRSQNRY